MRRTKNGNGKSGPKNRCTLDMAEQAYQLCLLGLTCKELAYALDVAEQTLENWQKNFPFFKKAIQEGRKPADGKVVRKLFERACGYEHPDEQISTHKMQRVTVSPDGSTITEDYIEVVRVPYIKHYPPDTGACAFWVKSRTKNNTDPFIEVNRTEWTGKGGGPIAFKGIPPQIDLTDMSTEKLILARELRLLMENKSKELPETTERKAIDVG